MFWPQPDEGQTRVEEDLNEGAFSSYFKGSSSTEPTWWDDPCTLMRHVVFLQQLLGAGAVVQYRPTSSKKNY